MIKLNIKEEKGVTLVILAFAILIMVIITSTLIYNARNRNANKSFK